MREDVLPGVFTALAIDVSRYWAPAPCRARRSAAGSSGISRPPVHGAAVDEGEGVAVQAQLRLHVRRNSLEEIQGLAASRCAQAMAGGARQVAGADFYKGEPAFAVSESTFTIPATGTQHAVSGVIEMPAAVDPTSSASKYGSASEPDTARVSSAPNSDFTPCRIRL